MEPPQIAGKIFRGDASTTAKERIETGVPVVDGLDMQFPANALARRLIERILVNDRRKDIPQGLGADGSTEDLPSLARDQERSPLRLSRTKVSSASTMPRSFSVSVSIAARKRCRQRKAVLTAMPQRSADAATVSPLARHSPNVSQTSLWCRPLSGIPVTAPKVLLQDRQR